MATVKKFLVTMLPETEEEQTQWRGGCLLAGFWVYLWVLCECLAGEQKGSLHFIGLE